MALVAVDMLGIELKFKSMPVREIDTDYMINSYQGWFDKHNNSWGIELPKGTIKKLIGRDLTYEDNPVELKEE